MYEAELGRVKHRSPCGDLAASEVPDVHLFPDERRTRFTEMNADLVLASGLESALDEGRAPELFEDPHVCDGVLGGIGSLSRCTTKPSPTPTQSVATIFHDRRVVCGIATAPMNDRYIASVNRVSSKL